MPVFAIRVVGASSYGPITHLDPLLVYTFQVLPERIKDIGITLDIYAYLLPGAGKSAARRFDKLLESWLAENVGKMLAEDDEPDARLEGFEPTTLGSEDRCSVR